MRRRSCASVIELKRSIPGSERDLTLMIGMLNEVNVELSSGLAGAMLRAAKSYAFACRKDCSAQLACQVSVRRLDDRRPCRPCCENFVRHIPVVSFSRQLVSIRLCSQSDRCRRASYDGTNITNYSYSYKFGLQNMCLSFLYFDDCRPLGSSPINRKF